MGKNKEERRKSYALFQKKLEIRQASKPAELSDEHFRLAALFMAENPEHAAQHCDIPEKVLNNLANGRYSATIPQRRDISTAAIAMGWKPPEA